MGNTRDNESSENLQASHGGTVRGAMSPLEQALTFGVMALNLALGAWFLGRADFSGVLPNSASYVPTSESETQPEPEPQTSPMLVAGSGRPIE